MLVWEPVLAQISAPAGGGDEDFDLDRLKGVVAHRKMFDLSCCRQWTLHRIQDCKREMKIRRMYLQLLKALPGRLVLDNFPPNEMYLKVTPRYETLHHRFRTMWLSSSVAWGVQFELQMKKSVPSPKHLLQLREKGRQPIQIWTCRIGSGIGVQSQRSV